MQSLVSHTLLALLNLALHMVRLLILVLSSLRLGILLRAPLGDGLRVLCVRGVRTQELATKETNGYVRGPRTTDGRGSRRPE